MPKIKIGQTTIDFPNTGKDATWSPAIIQFAQAVETRFNSISSGNDVSPTTYQLQNNPNIDLELPGTSAFNSALIRSFAFSYSIYRVSTGVGAMSLAEVGTVNGVFDNKLSTWFLEHNFEGERQSTGESYHTFEMVSGKLTLSTIAISGAVYDENSSKISYSAKTLPIE